MKATGAKVDRHPPLGKTLAAGPVIGMLYFLVVYLAAEAACSKGLHGFGPSTLRAIIFSVTAGAVAGLLLIAVRARRLNADGMEESGAVANRQFVGSTTLILCGMFLFFILLIAAPVIGSSLC